MVSSFWKVCGFAIHMKTGDLFSKSAFSGAAFRISKDGQPKRCNTCAFSQKSVVVWTGPKSSLCFYVSMIRRHS